MKSMVQHLTLAHFTDTHLGFSQYAATNQKTGRNARGEDFVRAFRDVVLDIEKADPALIIHAGDFFDNSRPSWRHVIQGQRALSKLSENKRLVIVIAGNHDMPADASEACPVDLYDNIDGVITASSTYKAVDLTPYVDAGRAREELRDVVVHLLPHDVLRDEPWDEVKPHKGKTNILISHCVVAGSALYKRSIGREYSLPIDVCTRGWDYVALGHFHKQGPVPVGGFTEKTSPIWYAGSTENNGFSDVRDAKKGGGRGWLKVHVPTSENAKLKVEPQDVPIRTMFRLPVIDADGLDGEAIADKMLETLKEADIKNAVVRQVIQNVNPDTWGLVDVTRVKAQAGDALWYETKAEFFTAAQNGTDNSEDEQDLGDLRTMLEAVWSDKYETDPDKSAIETLAKKLLGDALEYRSEEEEAELAAQNNSHTHCEED